MNRVLICYSAILFDNGVKLAEINTPLFPERFGVIIFFSYGKLSRKDNSRQWCLIGKQPEGKLHTLDSKSISKLKIDSRWQAGGGMAGGLSLFLRCINFWRTSYWGKLLQAVHIAGSNNWSWIRWRCVSGFWWLNIHFSRCCWREMNAVQWIPGAEVLYFTWTFEGIRVRLLFTWEIWVSGFEMSEKAWRWSLLKNSLNFLNFVMKKKC